MPKSEGTVSGKSGKGQSLNGNLFILHEAFVKQGSPSLAKIIGQRSAACQGDFLREYGNRRDRAAELCLSE